MESTSFNPFQWMTQQHTLDTSTENVPRRTVFRINLEIVTKNIKSVGKRMPIDKPIKLQEGGNNGKC